MHNMQFLIDFDQKTGIPQDGVDKNLTKVHTLHMLQ